MASALSEDESKEYEQFIREHEPYPDDAPEVNCFDYDGAVDQDRVMATLLKKLLEGKIKDSPLKKRGTP